MFYKLLNLKENNCHQAAVSISDVAKALPAFWVVEERTVWKMERDPFILRNERVSGLLAIVQTQFENFLFAIPIPIRANPRRTRDVGSGEEAVGDATRMAHSS